MPFDPKAFLATLTTRPGVYRMLDAAGDVLYVGKARNLKRRVGSYFRGTPQEAAKMALVEQIADVEVTVTRTEAEALVLENDLIKRHRPRFNVLLRDDKGYPYIFLSAHPRHPRLEYHRGPRTEAGRYFGPYPSAGAVRQSLQLLQRLFRVRQCDDGFYANRSRPCLQYQIKRCSAPCVGLVADDAYAEDVRLTQMVLEGQDQRVIERLADAMEAASAALDYERAALLRDQIAALRHVQERQAVSGDWGSVDVIAVAERDAQPCVAVLYLRAGQNLGSRAHFPIAPPGSPPGEILQAFLLQHYLAREVPDEIVIAHAVEDRGLVEEVLRAQAGRAIRITLGRQGQRARWVTIARANAEQALATRLASRAGLQHRFQALTEALELPEAPERVECFDVSHTMGERTVASCVVFTADGPLKGDYRRYNVQEAAAGDDFGAMREVLMRRYSKVAAGEGRVPDLILVDGGKGQLGVAREVLAECQFGAVPLVAVAKGAERKPGNETLFLSGREAPIKLSPDSPALHLIQQVRDEAHRFAIAGHRQRRARARNESPLESIPGIGARRRQELLRRFGGLREVARAGVEELAKVPGINRELAQRIFDRFHS